MPVEGTIPAISRSTDLLKQLAVTVKDVNLCTWLVLQSMDIPCLMEPIPVRGKVMRIIDRLYMLDVLHATRITVRVPDIPYIDRMLPYRDILKNRANLSWPGIHAVFVQSETVIGYRD